MAVMQFRHNRHNCMLADLMIDRCYSSFYFYLSQASSAPITTCFFNILNNGTLLA